MYLDWRGVTGTAAVHVGMLLSPSSPIRGEAICLCHLPQQIEPVTMFNVSEGEAFVTFADHAAPRASAGLSFHLAEPCQSFSEGLSSPALLSQPPLPAQLTGAGPFTLCVMVRPDGSVGRVKVIETGEHGSDILDQVEQTASLLRFAPARRDGVAIPAEIEVRLFQAR